MAMTMNVTDHWSDGKRIHVVGTLTPSGSYVTGGDSIDMSNYLIKTGAKGPIVFSVQPLSLTGDATNLYYLAATGAPITKTNCRVFISVRATDAELAAGAYSGTVTSNPPAFYAIFSKH